MSLRKRSYLNIAAKHALLESSGVITLRAMRQATRRLLFILCALAFFGGTAIGFAMHPAAAGEPCAEHQGSGGTADHHHDKQDGNCLTCCVGACVALSDLPPHPAASLAPLTATAVAYWGNGFMTAGRSIAPDLGPPRLSA